MNRDLPRTAGIQFVALALSLLSASPTYADEAQDAAAAESIFREGRALLGSGKIREACDKFSESKRLDPAPGTVLNLAQCYEALGRTASAWVSYRELDVLATKLGQPRRAEFAREKSAALERTLPMLVIHVAPANRVDGLAVEYDGTKLGSAAWGTRVPVDPGSHRVGASAPGRLAWSTNIEASAGTAREVEVPLLAMASADLTAGPGGVPTTPAAPAARPSTLRIAGIATTITGAAALGAGLVFGGIAKLENDGARRDECSNEGCSGEGLARIGRADDFASVSTALTITGISLAAIGLTMWLIAPTRAPQSATARLRMRMPALSF